ncbi:MAG: J domain-containing protein [Leptolyngbyaceae cyanobacterium SM2_5_2]|nr:J domain-containing protein [Leptolyngbyaceae cyanobacterium SM2_5_2]
MPDSTSRIQTHYDLLGVKPTASPQRIRQAFRELSKLYHPDTTTLPADEATAKFQQLSEAYGVLSSPDRRWSYDKQVGYSRISVMQPLEPLSKAGHLPRRKEPSNMYLDPTDRPLSAGEIFALFILGLTFMACLALVVTVGLARGDYTAELEKSLVAPESVFQGTTDVGDAALGSQSLAPSAPSLHSPSSLHGTLPLDQPDLPRPLLPQRQPTWL